MNLHGEQTRQNARMALAGELTIYSAAEVKAALAEAMTASDRIEVDLSAITEFDTAGLQLLLIAKRQPGKSVDFANPPPCVLRLLELANLGAAFGLPASVAACQ